MTQTPTTPEPLKVADLSNISQTIQQAITKATENNELSLSELTSLLSTLSLFLTDLKTVLSQFEKNIIFLKKFFQI